MKKPILLCKLYCILAALVLVSSTTHSQITGNTSPLAVTPSTATLVDPTITVGGIADLTDATVQITANYYNGDVLDFDAGLASSFGISGNYETTAVSGILKFTGTTSPANWEAIFRTVTYQNTNAACGPSSRSISFLNGQILFNGYNQHYYEFVGDNLNWKDAKDAAGQKTFNGLQGYLATSTSAGENNFIWKLMQADAWVGASYDYEEVNAATGTTTFNDQSSAIGHVYWVTGPEKGTYVSSDLGNPIAQNGQYMNWAGGEPNNAGDEYYVELYSGNNGMWNDLPIGSTLPYLVEYGGMPGDVPQNNTFSKPLTLNGTVGGDIMGGDISVCAGSNSVTLSTSAALPGVNILRWESSVDNFLTPGIVINNTNAALTVSNLNETTFFRSIASGNSCVEAPSSSTKIIVGESVPGTIFAANTTICNGSVATLTLSGNNGDIVKWQSSPDNFSWSDIVHTSAIYVSGPLSQGDYYFRVEVQNPSCPSSVFSNAIHITVNADAPTVGGIVAGAENACGPGNTGLLTVSGHTGNITKWQSSTNGVSWSDIINNTENYTFNDISSTTTYRAVIQNGSCPVENSSSLTVIYSGTSNTWIGTTSTDYGDATNWTCAIPGAGTNIVISETAPNMPVLDQNRVLGSILFENNTSLDINGRTLTILGELSGGNTGVLKGSGASSLILDGNGNAGTVYFDQSNPGTTDVVSQLIVNKNTVVIPTPASSSVCTPDASWGNSGAGIENVTLGDINNSTAAVNGYNNYFNTQSTLVDPSANYTLSVTMGSGYYDPQSIKAYIDWNNNGTFGDQPNETITDLEVSDYGGTHSFNFTVPAIGGDIEGGSKTMRIFVDNFYYMSWGWFDMCWGGEGEYEDYKINLSPLPLNPGQITLGNNLSVTGAAIFTKGKLITDANTLIINDGATSSGASDESYVNGTVRKVGNSAFTFPIGNSDFYAPIGISAPASSTDHFTASYYHTDPLSVYNNTTYANNLVNISNTEYWILDRTNGSSNVTVTLSWDAARSASIANMGRLRVSRWDGLQWTDAGNAGISTGNTTAGTITSLLVNNFSPFTIGTSSFALPVNLVSFTAIRANKESRLNWQTASETNNNRFDVERSIDGNNWIKIGEVKSSGNSSTATDYRFTDSSPAIGNNYYRVKQVDNDGKFSYSQVRLVYFEPGLHATVYPNPFASSVTVDAGNKIIGDLKVIDLAGRIVFGARITKTKETINLSHLPAGQYTVVHNSISFKLIKMGR